MRIQPPKKLLPILLTALWSTQSIGQPITSSSKNHITKEEKAQTLPSVHVFGEKNEDEKRYDDIYDKDISNVYVDRKYLDRYRGVSVGDVFAGMNGVYNSDNRNGASLFPNIRGLQGNGRVPVTVDGTVQSIDVWMTMQGINNRNYVDPNMFRSIMVEKGPAMTRGLKNGIGGSVNIQTINAGDIIQDDKNWGLELKFGTASNSIKSNMTDSHSLVGKDYRDIPGAVPSIVYVNPGLAFYSPQAQRRERHETKRFNLEDNNVFIASGYKHELFDVLAAYSYNKRGNYFAGTKGAEKYKERGVNKDNSNRYTSINNLYASVAKVFDPGWEVPFTSSELESILLKNNWYFPNNHTLNLSYSKNKLDFAELPPNMADWTLWNVETGQGLGAKDQRTILDYPYPNTLINQETFRLGYQWKPEHSNFIDFEAAVWRTESHSDRYQNGDTTFQVTDADRNFDQYTFLCYLYNMMCDQQPVRDPNIKPSIFIGTLQQTKSTRTGIDLSNHFKLSDNLNLTLAADYQFERQRDHIPVEQHVTDSGGFNRFLGPVSGRREEYGFSANIDWQASERWQLSAGVRYGSYWGFDDELDEKRRNRHPHWKSLGKASFQRLYVSEAFSDEEMQLALKSDPTEWGEYRKEHGLSGTIDKTHHLKDPNAPYYRMLKFDVPLIDSTKADKALNPFYNGTIDLSETTSSGHKKYLHSGGVGPLGNFINDQPTEEEVWQRPVKRRQDAWSSQLVASYLLTEHARIYARYASMVRFPSLYESASGDRGFSEGSSQGIRPERNQAWEIGYSHDLSHLLDSVRLADIKISYYHNNIRNFIDRNVQARAIQFDRKIMSGIEFQSRLDTGLFHTGFDLSYRLRQETCDEDYAITIDPYLQRLPSCMAGGFPRNLSFVSLQPKYSINLDLGVRLLNDSLNIGARGRYHSKAENKKLDRLMRSGSGNVAFDGSIRPYYWDPVKLIDLYAEYQFNRHINGRIAVENVTDRYYLDPLSKSPLPGPGRTLRGDLSIRF